MSYVHTGGMTPRHFEFDPSGRWCFIANQDTNDLSVFSFNVLTGALEPTLYKYYIPSPNFVLPFTNERKQLE